MLYYIRGQLLNILRIEARTHDSWLSIFNFPRNKNSGINFTLSQVLPARVTTSASHQQSPFKAFAFVTCLAQFVYFILFTAFILLRSESRFLLALWLLVNQFYWFQFSISISIAKRHSRMWHQMHSINLIVVVRTPHLHFFQLHFLAILTLHLIMYLRCVCVRQREKKSQSLLLSLVLHFIIYILFYGNCRRPFSAQTCAELTDVLRFFSYFIYISHYSLLDETLWAISLCHGHYQCHLFSFSADTHCRQVDTEMWKSRTVSVRVTLNICTQ